MTAGAETRWTCSSYVSMTGADYAPWIADDSYVCKSSDGESSCPSARYALEGTVPPVEAPKIDLYGAANASD